METQQNERECLPAESVNAVGQHIDDCEIDKVTQHEGVSCHLQTDARQKDENHAEKDNVKAQLHEENRLTTRCGDDGNARAQLASLKTLPSTCRCRSVTAGSNALE